MLGHPSRSHESSNWSQISSTRRCQAQSVSSAAVADIMLVLAAIPTSAPYCDLPPRCEPSWLNSSLRSVPRSPSGVAAVPRRFPDAPDEVELPVDPAQRPAELVGDLLVGIHPHLRQGDLAE